MTLDDAIKVLGNYRMESSFAATEDFEGALKLGIEALKRIKNARNIGYSVPADLLPGETKEQPRK